VNRSYLIRVGLFGLLHYVVLLLLESATFLVSHSPPAVINLDRLIVVLAWCQFI